MSEPPIVPDVLTTPTERPAGYRGAKTPTGGGSILTTFFLIILLTGLVVLGWLTWQQHQAIVASKQELAAALANIEGLSEQQTSIDSTFNESTKVTDDAIEFWESEIRKLWDVANKRNKNNIDQNRNSLAATKRDLEKTEASISSLEKSIGDLARSIATVTRQQQDLADNINATSRQLIQKSDDLRSAVTENQRAINAIDASRSQNNARLLEITRRLSLLESK